MTIVDGQASAAVTRLADELLTAGFDADPLYATMMGVRDRDDRLPDYTEAGDDTLRARLCGIVSAVDAIDPSTLDAEDRITRAVVRQQADAGLDHLAIAAIELTAHPFASPVVGMLAGLPMITIEEPAHADGYLARLAAMPAAIDAIADRHRAGIAAGRTPVRTLVLATIERLDRYLADPDLDPLREPSPPEESSVDGRAFRAAREKLLDRAVRPAVARYREMLATELAPHARGDERPGLCWLPEGEQTHARLARVHTTTDSTPAHLHETGLSVMAGLAEACAEIGEALFRTRDLGELVARVRDDPTLRWTDAEEPLAAARTAVARAEAAAPAWFGRLPRRRCVVEPVPAQQAPDAPPAYYLPPALDGGRAGTYFVNTHEPGERSRCLAEDLAFHEAVPGHHFQMALAQELTDLPMLRRLASVLAYEEGWGLYAESLADEMGLYSGPVARLGMLTAQALRAARLVVDTGLHTLGWSRRRAVDYLLAHSALTLAEIEIQVDLYLAAPGQALSYMVGRLEIERLRVAARERLGARFDIRAFHDRVLGHGPLPLGVLGEVVTAMT
jgi:uncharacterized protein (DUF885 family)